MYTKRLLAFALIVAFGLVMMFTPAPAAAGTEKSPSEVVERLWKLATEGELLNPEGWNRYSGFFLHPSSPGEKGVVHVVSNHWGVDSSIVTKETQAEVTVEYADAGRIDSALRYTPPPKTPFFKTALIYHLVLAPTHSIMLKSDGKVITGKEERTGPVAWQIADSQGLPFATVNAAIRYVLEMRGKTKDPTIRKNADETLAKLLRLH